ncbi:uncharacterized protein LACBIDRAFT_304077 [Laccaria bicolor S238N-H82]|uniref:Predicted protein n=1 Tax=Laccaria bicolor (strain S238N-H82 / ATCC MYA-4686) TaxID=486041 RepID=B0DKX0_LACBS|nr:uncharacterized protein LACBIDRAFT_304077 [Laccaria bicolor S238N-H82]EDR04721.1 predicted protein [Laccaria bicolor S238N-H82]|eukprot:XP_001884545.1 predicted protein [Laccaria bicolor S238N-H82]
MVSMGLSLTLSKGRSTAFFRRINGPLKEDGPSGKSLPLILRADFERGRRICCATKGKFSGTLLPKSARAKKPQWVVPPCVVGAGLVWFSFRG